MQLTNLILTFAATASAIDVYFHSQNNCNGASRRWNNVNPGTCINTGAGTGQIPSIAWRGVPTNWRITYYGTHNQQCTNIKTTHIKSNVVWTCMSGGYWGARYQFTSKKRAIGMEEEVCLKGEGECEGNLGPADEIVAEDGTIWELKGLSEEEIEELYGKVVDGSEIPKEFEVRRRNVGA
ncbi:hypothetical protein CGCA056_v013972 [Colletotrichum aenigma]|uniref:uncharacterized protein n=1 Tax=Colletotrichum aenigma TaxID=1215731 RepID=UPI0018725254|nr:uncharacterized protein CGCA056_v013972 [Colletotrichum aenigma]KAF5502890.1 hypothetical protein CGCA056_v013972 [Colletotrichum aenigma]